MTAFWIHRNAAGIVEGAIVAAYARPAHLAQCVAAGEPVELVDAGDHPVFIGRPLAEGVRVIETRGKRQPPVQPDLFDAIAGRAS